MFNALLLPCEEALTLIPPSCSDHFIHFSGLFKKRKRKKSKTKYIVKMAFIWTNSFYIFIKPCKKTTTSFWHITVSLTTEQFSHLNKLYIVKLIVANCIIDCIVYYIKCEFVPLHFKRSLCSTAYFRLLWGWERVFW